ncbi:MAG: hypothetical protein MI749_13395 [Desulfovibrionales bacterium]|nr:hypothetical protein [Desulfovibrionales bacterium]
MPSFLPHKIHFVCTTNRLTNEMLLNICQWVEHNLRYKVHVWVPEDIHPRMVHQLKNRLGFIREHNHREAFKEEYPDLKPMGHAEGAQAVEQPDRYGVILKFLSQVAVGVGHERCRIHVYKTNSLLGSSVNGVKLAEVLDKVEGKAKEDLIGLWALYHHGGFFIDWGVQGRRKLELYCQAIKDIVFARYDSLAQVPVAAMIGARSRSQKLGNMIGHVIRMLQSSVFEPLLPGENRHNYSPWRSQSYGINPYAGKEIVGDEFKFQDSFEGIGTESLAYVTLNETDWDVTPDATGFETPGFASDRREIPVSGLGFFQRLKNKIKRKYLPKEQVAMDVGRTDALPRQPALKLVHQNDLVHFTDKDRVVLLCIQRWLLAIENPLTDSNFEDYFLNNLSAGKLQINPDLDRYLPNDLQRDDDAHWNLRGWAAAALGGNRTGP